MKITLTNDDGSTVEFVVAPAVPTQVVDVTPGETVEVVATEAPATPTA